MNDSQQTNEALQLGELIKHEADFQDAEGETLLLARLAKEPSRLHRIGSSRAFAVGTRLRAPAAGVAALLAAAALLVTLMWPKEDLGGPTPLSFRIQDTVHHSEGHVSAGATQGEAVIFTDGSEFNLGENSSLRISELTPEGARLVLEKGDLESKVVKRMAARWSVFAGPYEIRVIGTRFDTRWSPKTQALSVVLHQGAVQILGAGISSTVDLKAGQRFDTGGDPSGWKVTPLEVDEPVPAVEVPVDETSPETASEPVSPKKAKPSPSVVNPPPRKNADWASLVARGEFAEVIDQAAKRGANHCLGSCGPKEVRALADAARYTGNVSLARQALTHLRSNSPKERARAGYLLGSLSEARGQAANALHWYTQYTSEAPQGALVQEAATGRLRCLLALGKRAEARAAAKLYLSRYPAGIGAKTARQILE